MPPQWHGQRFAWEGRKRSAFFPRRRPPGGTGRPEAAPYDWLREGNGVASDARRYMWGTAWRAMLAATCGERRGERCSPLHVGNGVASDARRYMWGTAWRAMLAAAGGVDL